MAALKLEQVFYQFPQKTFTISALVKSRKNVESYLGLDYAFLTATKTLDWTTVISVHKSGLWQGWFSWSASNDFKNSDCLDCPCQGGQPYGEHLQWHSWCRVTRWALSSLPSSQHANHCNCNAHFNFSTEFSQSFYHNLKVGRKCGRP